MQVYINDQRQDGVRVDMPQTGDAQWYNFIDLTPFTVRLPAGEAVLKLTAPGDCGNLDYLTFEKAAAKTATAAAMASMTAGSDTRLMLLDVYNDPALMGDFLARLSLEELARLCSGQPSFIRWPTGGFGNLAQYGISDAQMLDGPAGVHTFALTTA